MTGVAEAHPPHQPLRILLTEGSSLSARQAIYALGAMGHVLDLCDPHPVFCLGRYSRFVRACYRSPCLSTDPRGYLEFLVERLEIVPYEVLLPTHDQAYLLSRFRDRLASRVGLAVPAFSAMDQLESKAGFLRVLDALHLPHPATTLARTRRDLEAESRFPYYIKLAVSTAGQGVWLVNDTREREEIIEHLEREHSLAGDCEVLVQEPGRGVLGVVQSIFEQGRLVAAHCYQAVVQGLGGSARVRISASHGPVFEHLQRLGKHLDWHGALALDYLWDADRGQPSYIDANPRIGESFNATLSGVNLCECLVRVALGAPAAASSGRTGVKTHSIITTLLALAEEGASRRRILSELSRCSTGQGVYAGSEDEITRPRDDYLSLLPAVYAVLRLLIRPRSAARMVRQTVQDYALSAAAAAEIRRLPADLVANGPRRHPDGRATMAEMSEPSHTR